VQEKITVVEVGPRDGFQMEPKFIPTELKARVIDQLSTSGIQKIETTSFVHPKVIPQMADALDVMRRIVRRPGVVHSGLVANIRGAERAVGAQVDAIRMVICVTESYNFRNAGMSIAATVQVCCEVLNLATANRIPAEVALGVAFGCPLEGYVSEQRVLTLVGKLAQIGYREISLADSVGLANPLQVRELARRVQAEFPGVHFSLHMHNTRGLGLANILAALDEGIDTFDSSLGGLGGCPMVPGGTGNVSTEDLVNMLDEMRFSTGVNLDSIMAASRMMVDFLGRQLPSNVLSAGTRQQLYQRVGGQRHESTAS